MRWVPALVAILCCAVFASAGEPPQMNLVDLNELLPPESDWHLEMATAVNDAGSIAGYGRRAGIPGRRAFLMQPVDVFHSSFEIGHIGEWQ